MWAVVRVLAGMFLGLLMVVILVLPCVDLPLTTRGAQPATPSLLSTVAIAWAVAAGICRPVRRDEVHVCQHHFSPGVTERGLLDLTCALLCSALASPARALDHCFQPLTPAFREAQE